MLCFRLDPQRNGHLDHVYNLSLKFYWIFFVTVKMSYSLQRSSLLACPNGI